MRIRRWVAATTTSLLTFGAVMAFGSATAFAVTANYFCNGYSPETGQALTDVPVPLSVPDVTATAPTTIRPFETFEITIPPRMQPIPEEVEALGLSFPVLRAQDLRFRVGIVGGQILGGSGKKVGGSGASSVSVNAAGNYIQFTVPDVVQGGFEFNVPGATFDVIAGDGKPTDEGGDGERVRTTTRTGAFEQDVQLTIFVTASGLEVEAQARCTSAFSTVSSTNIAGEPFGPPPTTFPPTTTAPPTTVAPTVTTLQTPETTAAGDQLPETGSSSAPIGLAGFAAVAAGLAVIGMTRQRFVPAEERE